VTVVNLADYARSPHPDPIKPTPTTGLNPVNVVQAVYESIRITDGPDAALFAAQEMIVTGCALLERDHSRDLALETLLMYVASTR
jgi:hypothetical protein